MLKMEATIEVGDQTKVLEFQSDEPIVMLGRESKNDFQIPLTTVSRQHCRITLEEDQYFIEDLGSSHGTALNGQKLNAGEKKLLRSGDSLSITKARISVSIIKQQIDRAPGEKTEMLAKRAVEDILRGLGSGEAKDDQPYLRIMTGPDESRTFKLQGSVAECVLGRSRESDLVVNDANASRRHALVKRDFSGVTIQDLGAKNPTMLNGKEIPKNGVKRLKDRDEISIGAVKIVFIDPDAELLQSLAGIPGFEPDPEPEEEPPQTEQQQAAPEDSVSAEMPPEESVGPPAEESVVEDPQQEAPLDESSSAPEESVAQLPPDAVAETPVGPQPGKFGPEIIAVIIGGVIVLLGVVVLLLLL